MVVEDHPDISISRLEIGREKAPLVIVDNAVRAPEQLIDLAARTPFGEGGRYFPGIRAPAPSAYVRGLARLLSRDVLPLLGFVEAQLRFTMCHYSLVTQRPEDLELWQRMPHIDAVDSGGIAVVHYLFRKNLGGTAFYRHRATNFEVIHKDRQEAYFRTLSSQQSDPAFPGPGYIDGDNPWFEQLLACDGLFNRMLVYRKNSLHSGSISSHFIPDPNPLTGRLSINSFADVVLGQSTILTRGYL